MEKLEVVKSNVVPWLMPNVDTDIITPMKRILKNYDRIQDFAFEPYRFVDGDGDKGELNPDFPLNKPEYANAKIMITGENFGSGSSRETAPEAIAKLGIRCLIGTSFGGIFFKNCFQQGILPIVFSAEDVNALAALEPSEEVVVDLLNQSVTFSGKTLPFNVEPIRRESLLAGLDDVGMTLTKENEIADFEAKDRKARPWIYNFH